MQHSPALRETKAALHQTTTHSAKSILGPPPPCRQQVKDDEQMQTLQAHCYDHLKTTASTLYHPTGHKLELCADSTAQHSTQHAAVLAQDAHHFVHQNQPTPGKTGPLCPSTSLCFFPHASATLQQFQKHGKRAHRRMAGCMCTAHTAQKSAVHQRGCMCVVLYVA